MKFKCAHCRKTADKPTWEVNRAQRAGLRLFCGRRCAGLARRTGKTKAQKRAEKKAYDARRRVELAAELKVKKAAYHRRTYDPALARVERKKRAAFHAEYCRRPSYRLWKREYDRRHRAKAYGPFADAFELTLELNREIKGRMTNHEIRQQNQTANKTQKREREAQQQERRHAHPAAYGL